MSKLFALLFSTAYVLSIGCVVAPAHRDCREHESWDGHVCHSDAGYEHYWDHPDHRDWHPAGGDHHDDHRGDDHHDDHH